MLKCLHVCIMYKLYTGIVIPKRCVFMYVRFFFFQSSTDDLLANSGSLVFSLTSTELIVSLNASQFFSTDFTIQRLCVSTNSPVDLLLEDPATALTVPTPFPGFPAISIGLQTVRIRFYNTFILTCMYMYM